MVRPPTFCISNNSRNASSSITAALVALVPLTSLVYVITTSAVLLLQHKRQRYTDSYWQDSCLFHEQVCSPKKAHHPFDARNFLRRSPSWREAAKKEKRERACGRGCCCCSAYSCEVFISRALFDHLVKTKNQAQQSYTTVALHGMSFFVCCGCSAAHSYTTVRPQGVVVCSRHKRNKSRESCSRAHMSFGSFLPRNSTQGGIGGASLGLSALRLKPSCQTSCCQQGDSRLLLIILRGETSPGKEQPKRNERKTIP